MPALTLRLPFKEVRQQIAVDLPGAGAVFTTRRGGSSQGPYAELNIGPLSGDDAGAVHANLATLEQWFGVRLAYGRQVHGTDVRQVSRPTDPDAELLAADGLITATPGIAATVFAADCVPVVIAGGGAVAAVHAGWKGLAGGVIANAVRTLRALTAGGDLAAPTAPVPGTEDQTRARTAAAPLAAAIGPAAGVCCYEVSPELHERFRSQPGYAARGANLDLKAIAAAQLRAAGVEQVHDVGICTICADPGLLFSHRRDHGRTGRQGALAWVTGTG